MPLHFAMAQGHDNISKLLIIAGAREYETFDHDSRKINLEGDCLISQATNCSATYHSSDWFETDAYNIGGIYGITCLYNNGSYYAGAGSLEFDPGSWTYYDGNYACTVRSFLCQFCTEFSLSENTP